MHKLTTPRIKIILYALVCLFLILAVRLALVQLTAKEPLKRIAHGQYRKISSILPKRGVIYDRNLKELAVSINLNSLFLDPSVIEDKDFVAERFSSVLNIKKEKILEKFNEGKSFVWLARKISPELERRVRELGIIKGIGFIKEPQRVYPHANLASHILGFVGVDGEGLEGIELEFDKFLKGTVGYRYTIRDAKKREVPGYDYREIPPADGLDVVLTIDSIIQSFVEIELESSYEKCNAKAASVIVMDPYTGEILALANRPDYDLNDASGAEPDLRRDRAISDFFEPGSSFKIVTLCAILEENLLTLDDELFCENGAFKWGSHTYHDHERHGWLTFKDVIGHSSNIGTIKAANLLGEKRLYRYIKRFGFGGKTGVDLPGEISGVATSPDKWSKLSLGSISIGQEVGVTTLQLACAISSLANGGNLVRPKIVDRIQDKTGYIIKKYNSKKLHRVISRDTAELARGVLRRVVDGGTGRRAEIEDYLPAGKTGTAQKVESSGGYSHSRFFASFIGFLPYNEPRFVIVAVMDEPYPAYYGGTVCAPLFKNIAWQILHYYKIEPTG